VSKDFFEFLRGELKDNPDLEKDVERERFNASVAGMIYYARKASGLSQKQLADMAETHQSVISRLEDADYDGHSLSMLQRIAEAFGKRLHIAFVDPIASQEALPAPIQSSESSGSDQTQTLKIFAGDDNSPTPMKPSTTTSTIAVAQ